MLRPLIEKGERSHGAGVEIKALDAMIIVPNSREKQKRQSARRRT